jgi:hypothetical protein
MPNPQASSQQVSELNQQIKQAKDQVMEALRPFNNKFRRPRGQRRAERPRH